MKDLITEARELCESATPGPWYWDVIDAHKCICLESARWKVMDFARYGMNGAAPRFLVDGIMERADKLLKSIPGKEHHRGFDNYIDHPDAAFIARSRTLIPELCDALEKAAKKNDELIRELSQLARESVKRDMALAKLEAEVEGWAKAKQEGRLVVLPCKVGDTVFTIELDCKDNPDHSQMCFCWNKSCKECDKSYLRVWENRNKTADIRSIVAEMGLCGESGGFGKTVFLTREEAKEALAKEGR